MSDEPGASSVGSERIRRLSPARRNLWRYLGHVRSAYPDWEHGRLVGNLRRAIPAYSRLGVWTVAMPFNSGPTELADHLASRFIDYLESDTREGGIDLGHVLVCLDLRLSFDLIDDRFASWAGDLGLHALTNYATGENVPIGQSDFATHANRADLLGDIDGENIARTAQPSRALGAVFDYYHPAAGCTHSHRNRFATFVRDLDLMDGNGQIDSAARERDGVLFHHIERYAFWEHLKNHLSDLRFDRMVALVLDSDLSDSPKLRDAIGQVTDEFVAFLEAGLAAEYAAARQDTLS